MALVRVALHHQFCHAHDGTSPSMKTRCPPAEIAHPIFSALARPDLGVPAPGLPDFSALASAVRLVDHLPVSGGAGTLPIFSGTHQLTKRS